MMLDPGRLAADPWPAGIRLPGLMRYTLHSIIHRSFGVLLCMLGLACLPAQAQDAAPAQPQAAAAVEESGPVHTTPGDARQGTFKTVQGDVTLARETSRYAVVVGDPVFAGDRILTGERSAAAFTLRDGSVLSIGPNSQFVLSEFDFEPTTRDGNILLTLLQGSLRIVTGLIAAEKPEQVRVSTPTTVIGVRGTDFIVEQSP